MVDDESKTDLVEALVTSKFDIELNLPQEDRFELIRDTLGMLEADYEDGVPLDVLTDTLAEAGVEEKRVELSLESLKHKGRVIEFDDNRYILT